LKISTLGEATRWSPLLVSLHTEYATYLAQRTYAKDVPLAERRAGRVWWYTHERDRSVYHRLARLQQAGVLFAYLESDQVCERTTNPVESINAQIRILTHAHRGMSESHLISMLDWFAYTHTENPSPSRKTLADWDQEGRPPRRTIPKKTTPSANTDSPEHYGTTINAQEGLWVRKSWAGRPR
jgi:hypothetical protein